MRTRKFFRDYVLNNLGLKVLALVISVGLWWVVSRDPTVESIVTAPIEFLHAPENLVMTADSSLRSSRGGERAGTHHPRHGPGRDQRHHRSRRSESRASGRSTSARSKSTCRGE